MSDTPGTIFHSALRFFSGTMLSRLSGMLRDMAMAYAFGTQNAIAALLVAFRFAHLLRRLFGEGAMQTALIPHLEALRKRGPQRAGLFFCDLALTLTYVLTFLIVLLMSILGGFLLFDALNPGNAQIAWLTFLMMPSLLFICLFGINASLLQCEKSYFSPSAAPVMFNMFWILGIVFSSHYVPSKAMSFLALFITLACCAQWAITLPKTYAILKAYGIKLAWTNFQSFSADVLGLAKPLALGIMGVAAAQVNNALDAIFARWADEQGPALLWYAIRLQQLPLALFGIAISGAILPPLSRAIKEKNFVKFQLFLDFALRRTLSLMLPMTIALFVFGDSCIDLIYGHGGFNHSSVVGTTQTLWGYVLGLIPMAFVLVLAPAFYASGDYRTPSLASVASMALNIALNALMVGVLDLGAPSVAIATSLSAWFNLAWLTIALNRGNLVSFGRNSLGLLVSGGKILAIAMVASLSVILFDIYFWGSSTLITIFHGIMPTYPNEATIQFFRLVLQGTIFSSMIILGAWFLKIRDLTHFGSPEPFQNVS